MRRVSHSTSTAPGEGAPIPLWQGAIARRLRRNRNRGSCFLRRASAVETDALLGEAAKGLRLAPLDQVKRMVARNPEVIQALCRSPDAAAEGLFAYLPLNAFGAGALTRGDFDGTAPDPAWICRAGEVPEAFYWWLIYAPGMLGRALGPISALFSQLAPAGAPVFTRAATAQSERMQQNLGFIEARLTYPDAPEWLVVAFPEGVMPSRRAETSPVGLTVEPVVSMEGLMKVFALRAATYLAEQFCTFDEEFDGNDFCASHFVATVRGDAAGAIRLRYFASFTKLERLCVRREHRGRGIKERLIEAALDHARAKGFRRIYGHARADLVPMWAEFGFRPIEGRKPFRFASLDYVEILRELEPATAPITLRDPPMMLTRPEGRWDEPGPLDLSNLVVDPDREALIRRHTRFRAAAAEA